MMLAMVVEQLTRGPVVEGLNIEAEAAVITAMMPGLGNYVIEGLMTPAEVCLILDYHLDRLFVAEPAKPNAKKSKPKKSATTRSQTTK